MRKCRMNGENGEQKTGTGGDNSGHVVREFHPYDATQDFVLESACIITSLRFCLKRFSTFS